MTKFVRSRAERHALTPIMRDQINSLRKMLDANPTDDVGKILSTNMIAGFVLELSLKLFYMTFHDNVPPTTHNLQTLWEGFPANWQEEIRREYLTDPRIESKIVLVALQPSPSPPVLPRSTEDPDLKSADAFFISMSQIFIHARYYYETVEVGEWAFIVSAPGHLFAMTDLLMSFYEHLLREAEAESDKLVAQ